MKLSRFLLGVHQPHWLADERCRGVPLFVSRRTLGKRKSLPRAITTWCLDSGGFTELQMHGRWTISPEQYVEEVRRYYEQIGNMLWAAPQDWMCEAVVLRGLVERRHHPTCPACEKAGRRILHLPVRMQVASLDEEERPLFVCVCGHEQLGRPPQIHVGRWRAWAVTMPLMADSVMEADRLGMDAVITFHGTGLTVTEHQRRTIENYLTLRRIAPDLPIIPVLQGGSADSYVDHVHAYFAAGVNLRELPIVGVGSVCRRQGTWDGTAILDLLSDFGLKLHGFGYKTLGLRQARHFLESADSLAWSEAGRRAPPLPGHDQPGPGRRTGHINCANCLEFALMWRAKLLSELESAEKFGPLFDRLEQVGG